MRGIQKRICNLVLHSLAKVGLEGIHKCRGE